jgi:hypothetical protein
VHHQAGAVQAALDGYEDGWGYPTSCQLPHALGRALLHSFA